MFCVLHFALTFCACTWHTISLSCIFLQRITPKRFFGCQFVQSIKSAYQFLNLQQNQNLPKFSVSRIEFCDCMRFTSHSVKYAQVLSSLENFPSSFQCNPLLKKHRITFFLVLDNNETLAHFACISYFLLAWDDALRCVPHRTFRRLLRSIGF